MIFNSLQFLVFFIVITILYFQLPHKFRWLLLLLGSCYFYMAFVPIYIVILGFTIVIDYFAGILLEDSQGKKRKMYLIMSLVANISVLAVFKYYNFINFNISEIYHAFGSDTPFPYLKILLPIGLSFHTFQAMSYTIEVYRGNQKAERHFGIYSLYVMFYPQLVAGPIERPQNLIHQFHEKHDFDYGRFKSGLMLMAFGLFKKVVIADRLAMMVDYSYENSSTLGGSTLLVATVFYAFQIYCDFSGYSEIAIGAARVMGFDLMENFRAPYFSASISEFWKRWHISLSTWFKDYLYIPLGGNRTSVSRWYFNLMVIFLVSGLWHGANWTFIIWGFLHGSYLIFAILKDKFLQKINWKFPKSHLNTFIDIVLTFSLVVFAWIFFRAENVQQAFTVIGKIFDFSSYNAITLGLNAGEIWFSVMLIVLLSLKEKYYSRIFTNTNVAFYSQLLLIVVLCYLFGVYSEKQFIYFQF
ncbi:MBOAT family O-acyltransferase [Flavobacterium noncentrifugens]|uniref:D-alanyl-lipoteichoic acid acyltransferase DltB, MBOAT superfamily n=1 Tax=Flavobacterium noncentrifugens TaxID=1128970 RepID=A0A1G8YMX6_9FLAO|nr:MBOAT family O-acyltransferase [Flavobacterium noncentrifugens]SDK04189.1 D-alanyl-lipoteichoic acid acyltransferase DltB, MBOAT superfamily [Flavobacterium noncentrifugens]